ncbi:hypothetical protein G7Y41_03660 [Schaalia sp. ZJ405]|uniref:DsbA family protein n=1 Tax=Schaalia sp. ZJ405 TaxID=2709403 RepID=UPI0013ED9746|nr:hypothetical protein [Schaalia sp. ZJ405]QPK81924.1 hypothetical protein G7Y41_03660 [Schaalia sp. ZJ405]
MQQRQCSARQQWGKSIRVVSLACLVILGLGACSSGGQQAAEGGGNAGVNSTDTQGSVHQDENSGYHVERDGDALVFSIDQEHPSQHLVRVYFDYGDESAAQAHHFTFDELMKRSDEGRAYTLEFQPIPSLQNHWTFVATQAVITAQKLEPGKVIDLHKALLEYWYKYSLESDHNPNTKEARETITDIAKEVGLSKKTVESLFVDDSPYYDESYLKSSRQSYREYFKPKYKWTPKVVIDGQDTQIPYDWSEPLDEFFDSLPKTAGK